MFVFNHLIANALCKQGGRAEAYSARPRPRATQASALLPGGTRLHVPEGGLQLPPSWRRRAHPHAGATPAGYRGVGRRRSSGVLRFSRQGKLLFVFSRCIVFSDRTRKSILTLRLAERPPPASQHRRPARSM